MKTKLILSNLLLFLFLISSGQTGIENEKNSNSQFLSGGWRVSDDVKFTRITTENLDTSFLFSIGNTGLFDSSVSQFVIYTDSLQNRSIVQEGGGLFAESNWVAISQKQSGSFFTGNWQVVGDVSLFSQISWKYYPGTSTRVTVGSFNKDKLFVLSINFSSNYCSGGRMIVYVDGSAIKDNRGRPLKFLEGSSIVGKGKKVEIVVEGNCSTANAFHGSLKISKL